MGVVLVMAVSVESEALRRSFSYLVNSIDTAVLLPAALSRGLITEPTRQNCNDGSDSYRRAEKFLSALQRTVNGNSEMFHIFVEILSVTGQEVIVSRLNG